MPVKNGALSLKTAGFSHHCFRISMGCLGPTRHPGTLHPALLRKSFHFPAWVFRYHVLVHGQVENSLHNLKLAVNTGWLICRPPVMLLEELLLPVLLNHSRLYLAGLDVAEGFLEANA